jgi:hypothetical protein
MPLKNQARVRISLVVTVLAACLTLMSCAANPNSKTYTRILTGSANPIGVQDGRLTVITLDLADGGPLMKATIDIVAAGAAVREPHYYRRTGTSDRSGMATFINVPRLVDVTITHPRGTYVLEDYIVPQGNPSEFRVYVETYAPRGRDECLSFGHCN